MLLTAGEWQEGSWQILGTCTALAPGQPTEARAWLFGVWILLQAVIGKHQINIPSRAGWAAVQKGGKGMTAPDLWHNLPEDEWSRVQVLNVPQKMLKDNGGDMRAWMQYTEAKLAAKQRATKEAPGDLDELKKADLFHIKAYEAAAERIGAVLEDTDHYMHGKLEQIETEFKIKKDKPKGRLLLFNQLVQQTPVEGQHKWLHHRGGVLCELCGKRIKACSTHSEISTKQSTQCNGRVTLTLKQTMAALVQESEGLDEEIEGHRWTISATSFGCKRCWAKIPLRSGKAALTSMQQSVCLYGPKTEAELGLRSRVHTTHEIWRRGAWLECKRCGRTTKEIQGKVQTWLSQLCQKGGGQRTLQFVQHSSES